MNLEVMSCIRSMYDPSTSDEHRWERFVHAIAAAAQVRPEAISRTTRLDDDLGIDSLALAELVVMLIVDFGMETLADDFDERDWSGVTVGALYEEYRTSALDST